MSDDSQPCGCPESLRLKQQLAAAEARIADMEVDPSEFLRGMAEAGPLLERAEAAEQRVKELEELCAGYERQCHACSFDGDVAAATAHGAAQATARIVAWMDASATERWRDFPDSAYAKHASQIASDIRRGDHLAADGEGE